MTTKASNNLRVGLVVPHIFMHRDILPRVIFSPGKLALDLADGLHDLGAEVTLFTPGPVDAPVRNLTANLSYFDQELAGRGDTYIDLLKKHPFTFITLARQVQSELIAQAFAAANADQLDIVHIYTNEEDIALPFAQFCRKPIVFTHHDPYNFLVKYKHVFPRYKHLNWLSISLAQRDGMPTDTHWIGNIYHGIDDELWRPKYQPRADYVAYFGRIIEPKGVHLAIAALKLYNRTAKQSLKLKIAGKHYAENAKDAYWHTLVEPQLDDMVEYVGFLGSMTEKQAFLGNAKALMVPSIWPEPFGMVMIEALACGTPVIGLDSGAISEIVDDCSTGLVVTPVFETGRRGEKSINQTATTARLAKALNRIDTIERTTCRKTFEARFTKEQMCRAHLALYHQLHQQAHDHAII